MTLHIKDGGVWKDATSDGLQVKDGGVWKESGEGHIKDGGVWKQFHQSQYLIERSLRFNRADSANLAKTFSQTGDIYKYTLSFWVKFQDSTGQTHGIIEATSGAGRSAYLRINNGYLSWQILDFSRNDLWVVSRDGTDVALRDYSAWYHIVTSIDLTQASAANVCKFYVNGEEVGARYIQAGANYVQSVGSAYNEAALHTIGRYGTSYNSGYLAEFHSIDGQILSASSFGELGANDTWQPIGYTGTYGTNGFYLNFSDNSTAAALGTDSSGNGHNWAVNNISVAAGAGNDSLLDSPSSYGSDTGAGGEVGGNYCTWNPATSATFALSNGNLDALATNAGGTSSLASTFYVSSGKWYAEYTVTGTSGTQIGLMKLGDRIDTYLGSSVTNGVGYEIFIDRAYVAGVETTNKFGVTTTSGTHVFGIALNMDAGSVQIYKNGTLLGTLASGLSGLYSIAFGDSLSGSTPSAIINFGQRPFAYTAPSGYKALCTTNLPTPTIADGSTVMEPVLYTGNGSTQTISGLNFSPDFLWIKHRNGASNHNLFDVIRGNTKHLSSNLTNAESTEAAGVGLTSFNSDGFSLGTDITSGPGSVNGLNNTYVAWSWDAGSSTVTNTDGSITSSVRANPSAGFSIVTYTGTSANNTVGHGLNIAPQFIIVKCRSTVSDWTCYHASVGATGALFLQNTGVVGTASTYWQNTAPTSTVFSIGTNNGVNLSGQTFVAYCFAPVAGYSSFGSYTGNGSADGPFVYTGFRPRWILIKRTQTAESWVIHDTARSPYNVTQEDLYPNTSAAEYLGSTVRWDHLSNGFKIRHQGTFMNANGENYIYAAFAEHPFKYARAR